MNADLERLARAGDPYWWDHLALPRAKAIAVAKVRHILHELRVVAKKREETLPALIDSILSEEVKA